MNPWWILLVVWVVAALMMSAGWYWQRRHANAGIVDVLWSCGMAGAAVLFALVGPGAAAPRTLLGVLGGLWGLRLAWHLWRRVGHEPEDGRYRALRERWQGSQLRFFAMFQFQAMMIPIFALPFLAASTNPVTAPGWLLVAVLIWLLGVGGEALADAQLARFKAAAGQRGKTCRRGLWGACRHPNYFFEWLQWFAYVALAAVAPLWWLAWSGPVLMFLFLRFISGIPFTEQQALRTRGDDYRAYQRSTPLFFPKWPRAGANTGFEE